MSDKFPFGIAFGPEKDKRIAELKTTLDDTRLKHESETTKLNKRIAELEAALKQSCEDNRSIMYPCPLQVDNERLRAENKLLSSPAMLRLKDKRIAELEIDRITFWNKMVRQKTEIERLQKAEQEALDTAAQRSARILELEAQIESRVTSKAKGWLQVNLELKADNERLRDSLASTHYHHKRAVYGCLVCDKYWTERKAALEKYVKDNPNDKLAKRLRLYGSTDRAEIPDTDSFSLLYEAADEIERLRSELELIAAGGDGKRVDPQFGYAENIAMRLQAIAKAALEGDK